MKRRPFLHLAVGTATTATAATTGGYLGVFGDSESNSTSDSTSTDRDSADSDPADRNPTLSVRRAETFDHVVRLNDLGEDPLGRISAFADLSDREREVVTTAIRGTYETDDPPEWLVEFASATPFVEREGSYYRLDDTFPTYRITAETVAESGAAGSETTAESEVEGEIATYAEYKRAVTCEEYVMSGLLRIARDEGIELSYVWPSLRNFFDNYDAARYHGEVLAFSVEIEDSGPPHRLSASEVSVSEAAGGSVWQANSAPEESRALVRRAGRARGAYGFDRAPAGLLDALQSHEYVLLGGTFYTSYVESRGSSPISVFAEFHDGRLRIRARNEADTDRRLSSGPPQPFGVVRCRSKGDGDSDRETDSDSGTRPRLLWTDAYTESDRVRTEGHQIGGVNDVAVLSSLAPGETVSENYEVPDLPPGEYVVDGSLGVQDGDGETEDDSTLRYRVIFSIA